MPSWNIHIAQTERLLNRGGVVAQTVVDRNAFLFGNLVPDIYVGYMVPGIEHPIAYRVTHVARPEHIPKPREWEFWATYVAPLAQRLGISAGTPREGADQPIPVALLSVEQDYVSRLHYPQRYAEAEPSVWQACAADEDTSPEAVDASRFDLVLGAWSHLVADNLWNTRVNEFLEAHGGHPSESFRIKKQGDFDRFGKAAAARYGAARNEAAHRGRGGVSAVSHRGAAHAFLHRRGARDRAHQPRRPEPALRAPHHRLFLSMCLPRRSIAPRSCLAERL